MGSGALESYQRTSARLQVFAHLTFLLKTSPPLPGRLVPLAELQRLPPYNKPYISLLQLK